MLESDFIAKLKIRAGVPTSQDLLTEQDFRSFADDEMASNLVPWLLKASEEHLTVKKDITLQAGVTKYQLPERAAGMKLRDVQVIQGSNFRSLNRLFVEDRTGNDYGFFLEGNEIEFQPTPTGTEVVRLTFHRSSSNLISVLSAQKINSISGNDVTVDSLPSAVSGSTLVDLIPKASPHYSLGDDVEVVGISGLTLTLSSVPSELVAGDYICAAGQTPYVQLPKELSPLLVSMVAARVHEGLGRVDQKQAVDRDVEKQKNNLLELISPRVDGEPKKVRLNALARR